MAAQLPTSSDDNGLVQNEEGLSIVDLIENLLFYWKAFVAVAVLVSLLAILRAIISTPIYTSDVLIQVEPQKGAGLGALRDVSPLLDAGNSPVPGEIEVLRSRLVFGRAIESSGTDLDVTILDRFPVVGDWLAHRTAPGPDGLVRGWLPFHYAWGGEELVLGRFDVPAELINTLFVLVAGEGGHWSLRTDDGRVVAEGTVGAEVASTDGRVHLRVDQLRARAGNRFGVVRYGVIDRLRMLSQGLTIAEAGRGSNIIRATYEDTDPARAAKLLNAIADAYVERNIGRRSEEAQKSLAFLREHLPQLKKQLEDSEGRLNDYRNAQEILDITTETKALLDRAVALSTQRESLKLKRMELSLQYEPAHPAIKAIDAQLRSLAQEGAAADGDIKRLPAREQRYLQLMRDVQVNNQLYVGLLNNAEQLEIAKAGTTGNVAIIDRALPAPIPTRPKKAQMAALGALLGLALGFGFTQMLTFMTGVIRDPKKLERATGVGALAILPLSFEQSTADADAPEESFLVALSHPLSPMSEALRSLRTAVLFALSGTERGKVVLITSSTPAQGKSLVAANLSYLMALGERRVLVIDADVRRRSLRNYLPIPAGAKGLTDVLAGTETVAGCVLKDVLSGLSVLPAGGSVRDPGGLFARPEMREIIDWATAHFDYVVIDSAPLLAVSDTSAIAKLVDQTLFIVRQNEASLSEVAEALGLLRRVGGTAVSFVFNGYMPSRLRYGYGYGYGYGRGYRYGYGRRYGYTYGYGDGSEKSERDRR
jgi:tyrosine-protein kinase Etk/Wzc